LHMVEHLHKLGQGAGICEMAPLVRDNSVPCTSMMFKKARTTLDARDFMALTALSIG
jgi:hypothetical protein